MIAFPRTATRFEFGFVLLLAVLWLISAGCERNSMMPVDLTQQLVEPVEFAAEVQAVLDRRMALVQELASDSVIIDAVRQANQRNGERGERELRALDERWKASQPSDPLVQTFLQNPCADVLIAFQERGSGFPEIFVTDARGLLVGQTNQTSDFVQSDEGWWQAAFAEGQGRSHTSDLEYDESAFSESISFSVPVLDPSSGAAIGVLKAVCDVSAIKMEL